MHKTPQKPGVQRSKSPILRLKSGVVEYYGYRDYDAASGRWTARDPIAEQGGLNLYGMVGNDAVSNVDVLGKELIDLQPHVMKALDGVFANKADMIKGLDIAYDRLIWDKIPPIPVPALGGNLNIIFAFTIEVSPCCDDDEGDLDMMFSASINPEIYMLWGKTWSWKEEKYQLGISKMEGWKQNKGFRDRNLHVDIGRWNSCPKGNHKINLGGYQVGLNLNWDIYAFLRGSTGIGFGGVQGNVSMKIFGNTFNTDSLWDRFDAEGSYAFGVVGASLEFGVGGTIGVSGKIEIK